MYASDLFGLIQTLRQAESDDTFEWTYLPLLEHIEHRVIHEVLEKDWPIDPGILVLDPPYDDVYWTYIMSMFDLKEGKMEQYREGQKLFLAAWKNLRRDVFLRKGVFANLDSEVRADEADQ